MLLLFPWGLSQGSPSLTPLGMCKGARVTVVTFASLVKPCCRFLFNSVLFSSAHGLVSTSRVRISEGRGQGGCALYFLTEMQAWMLILLSMLLNGFLS